MALIGHYNLIKVSKEDREGRELALARNTRLILYKVGKCFVFAATRIQKTFMNNEAES